MANLTADEIAVPCMLCDRKPISTFTPGIGYQRECSCGVAIPFPPAPTRELALRDWNRENKRHG